MPWLILLLVIVWLLGRAGLGQSRGGRPAPPPARGPEPEARQAASAWSAYVPTSDDPDSGSEPLSPESAGVDDGPAQTSVWTVDAEPADEAAPWVDELGEVDGSADPYDDVPDRSTGEVVDSDAHPERAVLDDEIAHDPGGGGLVDPADDPLRADLGEQPDEDEPVSGPGGPDEPDD